MIKRSTVWLIAVISIPINLIGGVMAASGGEMRHAGTHGVLLVLGAYIVLRLARSRGSGASPVISPQSSEFAGHLAHLQQSVDAIAVEVERVGEGQRFITRLFEENASRALGEGAAEPIGIRNPDRPSS